MAFLWRTNDNKTTSTKVQYGVGTALDKSLDGFTFVYDVSIGDPVRMHETHLCGLMPDTQYSYRVGGSDGSKDVWSPTYTFRTAPLRSATDAQLTLLNIGDTRDGYSIWGATLTTALQQAQPDYILFSGDETTLGPIQDEWDAWFMAGDPILASTPMIVAHGNHEVSSVNFFSQFAMPGDEQNFALDIGPVHLTVANDTPVDPADLTGTIAQTLDTNLKAAMGAPWSILVHHKPMWTAAAGPHPEDALGVRNAFGAIVDADNVDIVFNGHDHDYERTKPLRNGAVAQQGTVYVVVGSAGAPLYDSGMDFWTQISEKTYSFALAKVRAGQLVVNAYRNDGSMLDSFTLTK
jgi:hypothetical protein